MKDLKFRYLDPVEASASPELATIDLFLKQTGRTQIGWHYAIDLAWIFSMARHWPRHFRVLDAGGGRGPAQYMLAEMGFDVMNIDLHLAPPAYSARERYGSQLTRLASFADDPYVRNLEAQYTRRKPAHRLRQLIKASLPWRFAELHWYTKRHEDWRRLAGQSLHPVGKIALVQADLCAMPDIESGTFDAVVSLSALEHIPIESLPAAVGEIHRVLKPGGRVALTTSATHLETTWYHEPSKGLCFSGKDLESIFGAADLTTAPADEVLQHFRDSTYLRQNLASFYRRSGENGMPWGLWNPTYIPVAIWR
jgi:SAM-dependent methyltransferase